MSQTSRVRWLGDVDADALALCKADQGNRDTCASFAATFSAATGSVPIMQFYRDQCLDYLCGKGVMPSKSDMPPPPPPATPKKKEGSVAKKTTTTTPPDEKTALTPTTAPSKSAFPWGFVLLGAGLVGLVVVSSRGRV